MKKGARVAITSRRDAPDAGADLNAFAKSIVGHETNFLGTLTVDFTDADSVNSFVARWRAQLPTVDHIDTVVMNGGIACGDESIGPLINGVETTIYNNVVGPVRMAKALLPFLSVDNPSILFSSSPSARAWAGSYEETMDWTSVPRLPDWIPEAIRPQLVCQQEYSRSKALLDAAVMELAQKYPHVRWHAVYPGPTNTDLLEQSMMKLANVLYTPAIAESKPGRAFFQFWLKALARPAENVALQYSFAAWPQTTLSPNGCSFYTDKCLATIPGVEAILQGSKKILDQIESL